MRFLFRGSFGNSPLQPSTTSLANVALRSRSTFVARYPARWSELTRNGDGAPDVVTADALSGGDVSVLLGNGDGSFQPQQRVPVGDSDFSSISVAVADLNGDGAPDLVITNGPDISVLLHR